MLQISTPSSAMKCSTCQCSFNFDQQHKEHYKSDFHRYNLKRIMVCLPAVSLEQFSTKRIQQAIEREATFKCGQCRKQFGSAKTLNQHAQTKKHNIDMIVSFQPKRTIEQTKKIKSKNQKRCLFCYKQFSSLDVSLEHMRVNHSFFIPQENFCVDRTKLILYIQEKIEVGMICIFCNNKGAKDFSTGDAVRNHMLSKNHTFMNTENGFEQYENYYDFSSLFNEKFEQQKRYPENVGINFQKIKVIVDNRKQEANTVNKQQKGQDSKQKNQENIQDDVEDWDDFQSDYQQNEQQWEDGSESGKAEIISEQIQKIEELKQRNKRKIKTYQFMIPTITSTDQLLLPNGKMLGHRKYKHIYKQTLRYNNWFENNKKKCLQSGVSQHQLLLQKNLLDLIKKERLVKNFNRRESKKFVKSGIQNSNLFRHFRSSNPL